MSKHQQTEVKWMTVSPSGSAKYPFALLFWHANLTISARILSAFQNSPEEERECVAKFAELLEKRPHEPGFEANFPSLTFSEMGHKEVQDEFWTLDFFEQLSELKAAYARASGGAEAEIEINVGFHNGPFLKLQSLKELFGFLSKAS